MLSRKAVAVVVLLGLGFVLGMLGMFSDVAEMTIAQNMDPTMLTTCLMIGGIAAWGAALLVLLVDLWVIPVAFCLPLAVFGPAEGLRFWVMVITLGVLAWYLWPEASRAVRGVFAFGLATIGSFMFTSLSPTPAATNTWVLVFCTVGLAFIVIRSAQNGRLPITGGRRLEVRSVR